MDTDADTDTDTVIGVETVEWCLRMKELSSPHPQIFQEHTGFICIRASPA